MIPLNVTKGFQLISKADFDTINKNRRQKKVESLDRPKW